MGARNHSDGRRHACSKRRSHGSSTKQQKHEGCLSRRTLIVTVVVGAIIGLVTAILLVWWIPNPGNQTTLIKCGYHQKLENDNTTDYRFEFQIPIEHPGSKSKPPRHHTEVDVLKNPKVNTVCYKPNLPKELEAKRVFDIMSPTDSYEVTIQVPVKIFDLGWDAVRTAVTKLVGISLWHKYLPEDPRELIATDYVRWGTDGNKINEARDGPLPMKIPKLFFHIQDPTPSDEFENAMVEDIMRFLNDYITIRKTFETPFEHIRIKWIIDHKPGCIIWHTDRVGLRALKIYFGPGTPYVLPNECPDKNGPMWNRKYTRPVDGWQPALGKVQTTPTGSCFFMKGGLTPHPVGPAVHKSPNYTKGNVREGTGIWEHEGTKYPRRMMIKIDDL